MKRIDLNCDLGESYGVFKVGNDEEILPLVSSVNVACGYHAGDHNTMAHTVKLAKEAGARVGAHPGFSDLFGFGRRPIQTTPEDIYHFVFYQISALEGFCKLNGVTMQHVKPHGALFNMAAVDPIMSEAIAKAVKDANPDLILFGLSGSELIKAGRKYGLNVANEVFADRTYQPDGTLTPRNLENALITDDQQAVEQVLQMITTSTVIAVDGSTIPLEADTVCVHGDGQHALLFVKELRRNLAEHQIEVASLL
ncbi:5-oxoprolinase subunit PxpA [Alkalicoccobacillus porphyridii]|uniref:5-oxoprolinase subunit A n=1 Tax=Alkalicoccobacillus porphyridii TaxID=2597270 RepID=A0A554A380_9BACI|nr:5-oxoprolinase subunit PxpA [Alkalicoccobacillus porphyridii]TSB48153.1 LamB/YcsF family protein [Alkalicoccobacillus porphyridii]